MSVHLLPINLFPASYASLGGSLNMLPPNSYVSCDLFFPEKCSLNYPRVSQSYFLSTLFGRSHLKLSGPLFLSEVVATKLAFGKTVIAPI